MGSPFSIPVMQSQDNGTLQVPLPHPLLQVPGRGPWSFTWNEEAGQAYRNSTCHLMGSLAGGKREACLSGLYLAGPVFRPHAIGGKPELEEFSLAQLRKS